MKNIKIAVVGVGLGGRFNHFSKLKVMKFKEAINGPDSNKWKEEIENEKKKMVTNRVWEPLDKNGLPEEVKVITWIWACKKKAMEHTMIN